MVDQEKIHNKSQSDERKEHVDVLEQLTNFFSSIPDKQQAWNDLHRLTNDEDSDGRYGAALSLLFLFSEVPDKQQAWNDLHRLTNDEDWQVRFSATLALGPAFDQVPGNQQAWNDLHRLSNDENRFVRANAALALGSVFSKVPNKQWAWNILHKLTTDGKWEVRSKAAEVICSAFSQLLDKQQAWNDLHRLTNDQDSSVRFYAAKSLGFLFSQVPDKQQAWNDLHRLTNDEYWSVKSSAADALGSAFSSVPDKQKAWNDLQRLTNDEDSYVRTSSNHSLGRVSIFKASQAETDEDYKMELEKAIEFFEIAAKETSNFNPAQFCLPFYRSFHTIIFKKQEAKEEVNKYLREAKAAIEGSESKKQLFEAVENLAETLKEVQSLEKLSLKGIKGELNFYRNYCDHAAELMKDTDQKAPYATRVLRKGLPILDRNLKGFIEDIREKAKNACQVSEGPIKEIACAVNIEVQKWEIGNQEEMSWYVNTLVVVLKSKIPHCAENIEILDMIEYMKYEKDLTKQYRTLSSVIGLLPTVNVVSEKELDRKLDQKLQKFDLIFDEIIYIRDKLSCIRFDISNIKWNSADIVPNLKTMKEELEKLNKIEGLNTVSIEKLNSSQEEILYELNNNIVESLNEIKSLIDHLPKNNGTREFYDKLSELKQSKSDMALQKLSAITSLIGFAMQLYQQYRLVKVETFFCFYLVTNLPFLNLLSRKARGFGIFHLIQAIYTLVVGFKAYFMVRG